MLKWKDKYFMKNKNNNYGKNKHKSLLLLFLIMNLLIGCASTGINTKDRETKKIKGENPKGDTEKVNNVKISEFILGVGDTIEISVYRQDDLQRTVKIDLSGRIMFPLIGDIEAADKSIFKLRDEVKERLSKYIIDPQVFVNVTTVQSQKIMVLGEVNNPGIFTLDSDVSVIEAIARAGGTTNDAKLKNVLLIRKEQEKLAMTSLNLKKAFKEGDISQNVSLINGDVIYLPAITIANISRYFSHIAQILGPIVNLETGMVLWPQVKKVLQGKDIDDVPLTIPTN